MTLDTLIIFLGAFVTALPFLGFPSSWDTVLLVMAGVVIIVLGIIVRGRSNQESPKRETHEMFAESQPAGEAGAPRAEHDA